MDQISAHIDRGWSLAQKGDASGALACARRALELDPSSPEVHNLLGYGTALAGDSEEALEHYRQAIALDETYFEAMLNAAEVLMHPLEEWDEAVSLLDDALDLAETKEEEADCLLLRVDALLGKGDLEDAKRTMARLPAPPYDSPGHVLMIGRAYYELGEIERARPLVEEAARVDPDNPEAHYYLGLLRDEAGDIRASVQAFLKARALDLSFAPPPWSPSPEAFAEIVRAAVGRLDAILGRYVREADVYVVDAPGPELVVDGVDPRASLLLDAPRGDEGEAPRVRLFVYQRNVERAAGGAGALEEELAGALEREITSVFLDRDPDAPEGRLDLN